MSFDRRGIGALGTGLLSSNADQLKTVLLKDQKNYFHYTKIGLLGFSIFLQVFYLYQCWRTHSLVEVVVMSLMIYMGSNGQVKSHKRKKHQDPFNNVSMEHGALFSHHSPQHLHNCISR